MQVKRIAECSKWSILQYFRPSLSYHLSLRSLFCLFLSGFGFGLVLLLYIPVNSYGHVGTVSSANHTFFLGKLDLAVNQCFMHILSLVTDNNSSCISGREENGCGNYLMINLHGSMGQGPGSNWPPLDLQSDRYLQSDML